MDLNEAETVAKDAGSAVSGASSLLGKSATFLESLFAKIVIGLLILAVVAFLAFLYGRQSIKADYEKKVADRDAYMLKLQQELDRKQDKIVVQYVDKVRTINHEVKVYVSAPNECSALSGNFRLFHDSAATGVSVSPSPGDPDGAPVPIEDVANTTADNYRTCRETAEKLKALQAERLAVSGSH